MLGQPNNLGGTWFSRGLPTGKYLNNKNVLARELNMSHIIIIIIIICICDIWLVSLVCVCFFFFFWLIEQ
jgi:hypothetical protein